MHKLLESVEQRLFDRDQKRPWLAEQTGISIHTINGWYASDRMPRADDAVKVAHALGTTVEALVEGDRMLYFDASGQSIEPMVGDPVVMLPFIAQRASAGPGQELMESAEVQRHLPILASLIARYRRETLKVVEVRGDSMTAVRLNDGDLAIFAEGVERRDGIYVIALNGDVMVKRLSFDSAEQKVSISSENPRYPNVTVLPYENEILRIIGKVVGWLHMHPY